MTGTSSLQRDDDFRDRMRQWAESGGKYEFIRRVKSMYESSFYGSGDPGCDILREKEYSMIVIYPFEGMDEIEFLYFMDYSRDRILEENYMLYMSDVRGHIKDGGVNVEVHRHYLKPRWSISGFESGTNERRFGNIAVEVLLEDQTPSYFKITCTYFQDRNQKKEQPIDKLLELLLLS